MADEHLSFDFRNLVWLRDLFLQLLSQHKSSQARATEKSSESGSFSFFKGKGEEHEHF